MNDDDDDDDDVCKKPGDMLRLSSSEMFSQVYAASDSRLRGVNNSSTIALPIPAAMVGLQRISAVLLMNRQWLKSHMDAKDRHSPHPVC